MDYSSSLLVLYTQTVLLHASTVLLLSIVSHHVYFSVAKGCAITSDFQNIKVPNLSREEMDAWLTSSFKKRWINKGLCFQLHQNTCIKIIIADDKILD